MLAAALTLCHNSGRDVGSALSHDDRSPEIAWLCAVQADVFAEVAPLIGSVLDGYNACILAYGQTGRCAPTWRRWGALPCRQVFPCWSGDADGIFEAPSAASGRLG